MAQVFFCKSSFKEDPPCRTCPNGCLSDMNQKNYIYKIYFQEKTGDVVLFSALAEMWAYGFPK